MAEQLICNQQVAGSTPVASSNSENQVAPPVWDVRNSRIYAYLAQLVEQETLNFEVGGSNPSMGTIVTPLGRINHSKT